jgi:hypothetical protein
LWVTYTSQLELKRCADIANAAAACYDGLIRNEGEVKAWATTQAYPVVRHRDKGRGNFLCATISGET